VVVAAPPVAAFCFSRPGCPRMSPPPFLSAATQSTFGIVTIVAAPAAAAAYTLGRTAAPGSLDAER
jgi:hypothetical protein